MAHVLSTDYSDYSGQHFQKEQKHPSPQRARAGSIPSSPVDTYNEQDKGIFLQPETRPITQEQLVNEVKGSLYTTLV